MKAGLLIGLDDSSMYVRIVASQIQERRPKSGGSASNYLFGACFCKYENKRHTKQSSTRGSPYYRQKPPKTIEAKGKIYRHLTLLPFRNYPHNPLNKQWAEYAGGLIAPPKN